MDELLTVKDVIRIFQVSHQTVYRWMRSGKLRSCKIEGMRRFKKEDIEALFQSGRES